jgi:hypothetical protein
MNNVAFLEGAEYAAATSDDAPHDMTQAAIVDRVRQGKTTPADADQLLRWLNPTTQERIVKAYLCLICEASAARQFLAPDLREGLAQELIRDEHLPSDPEVRSD